MCESLKDYLGWSPGDEVLERKTMVEHSLALMERIRKVVESKACLPTSFTNGVNLNHMDLKANGKLPQSTAPTSPS